MAKQTTRRNVRQPQIELDERPSGALNPAQLVSRSLKIISKESRAPAMPLGRIFRDTRGRPLPPFSIGIVLAFILTVLLPVTFSAGYLWLFASDQYASEVRFAVRGGGENRAPTDVISGLTGSTSAIRLQDSMIVADFVRGRGMVEILEESLKLRQKFSGPNVDYIFGFNPARSIERLVRYWWWQITVSVERTSGIITVVVVAFTPQDALAIAKAIVSASEKLVNDLSDRSRRDSLRLAEDELALAERVLQSKISALKDLRTNQQTLDPTKTSEALTKVISEARMELLRLEGEYEAQKKNVLESAPQMRVLDARTKAAREQIKILEARLTNSSPEKTGALADSISLFDRLKLEQDLAQKQYVAASVAFERARFEVDSQQVYLTTFVQPVLAEEGIYPKRWWIMATIILICLTLWGAGTGIAVLVRNYAA
jgi:capsular polysaccharide transport system permease protein